MRKQLHLYSIRPKEGVPMGRYDVYVGAVVAALSPLHARYIHPSLEDEDVDLSTLPKARRSFEKESSLTGQFCMQSWPDSAKDIEVSRIGVAAPSVKAGVVLASFHAG